MVYSGLLTTSLASASRMLTSMQSNALAQSTLTM